MNTDRRRVILDECLPQALRHDLSAHDVQTADYAGLAGMKNGELLSAIEGRFDVFVTVDANIQYQRSLGVRPFGIVVLKVPSNRLADIRSTMPRLTQVIAAIAPGEVEEVS